MQTKAEIEAEIKRLRLRVAELEGAVEAYKFALSQNPPQPLVQPLTGTTENWWWWKDGPSVLPCATPGTITS